MWPTGAPPILYLDVTKEELKDDFCSDIQKSRLHTKLQGTVDDFEEKEQRHQE